MKKLLVLMGILLFAINPMNAKNLFQIETINSQRNEKVSKAAKKEAKKLKKYGWRVSSLEEQLDRSFQMMYQYDEDLFPKYIIGDARSTGEDYYAAKNQALELALQDLASNIAKHITALIDNRVANGQMGVTSVKVQKEYQGEAVSLKLAVNGSKDIISKTIQSAVPIIECYRTLSNKRVQVRVVIFYNAKDAMKIVEEEEKRAEREAKAEELVKSLDKLLGIE